MPFQTVLLFVIITTWKRKDHLNVISSQEVLFSLYFWIKERFISCRDLSPYRHFQELSKNIIKSQRFSFLLPPTSYPARTALLVTVFLCQVIIIPIIIIIFPLIVIVIMFAKLVELEIDIELPSSLDWYLQRGDPRNPERKRRWVIFFKIFANSM